MLLCEFKRCDQYYRTFKNPFASFLVEFDTTLLRILGSRINFGIPLAFDLYEIGSLWLCFLCRCLEDLEKVCDLMPVKGLFLPSASIQAQIIMKRISLHRVKIIYIFYLITFQARTGAKITGLATISCPCRPKGRNQEKHSKHTILNSQQREVHTSQYSTLSSGNYFILCQTK